MKEQSKSQNSARGFGSQQKIIWLSGALLFCALLIGANAHLVMVAVNSQPECVVHDKVADEKTAQFRAAKSGC